jgi:hypothetical protein
LGSTGSVVAYTAIIGGILFAAFMILVMPRILAPLARWAERDAASIRSSRWSRIPTCC